MAKVSFLNNLVNKEIAYIKTGSWMGEGLITICKAKPAGDPQWGQNGNNEIKYIVHHVASNEISFVGPALFTLIEKGLAVFEDVMGDLPKDKMDVTTGQVNTNVTWEQFDEHLNKSISNLNAREAKTSSIVH